MTSTLKEFRRAVAEELSAIIARSHRALMTTDAAEYERATEEVTQHMVAFADALFVTMQHVAADEVSAARRAQEEAP